MDEVLCCICVVELFFFVFMVRLFCFCCMKKLFCFVYMIQLFCFVCMVELLCCVFMVELFCFVCMVKLFCFVCMIEVFCLFFIVELLCCVCVVVLFYFLCTAELFCSAGVTENGVCVPFQLPRAEMAAMLEQGFLVKKLSGDFGEIPRGYRSVLIFITDFSIDLESVQGKKRTLQCLFEGEDAACSSARQCMK